MQLNCSIIGCLYTATLVQVTNNVTRHWQFLHIAKSPYLHVPTKNQPCICHCLLVLLCERSKFSIYNRFLSATQSVRREQPAQCSHLGLFSCKLSCVKFYHYEVHDDYPCICVCLCKCFNLKTAANFSAAVSVEPEQPAIACTLQLWLDTKTQSLLFCLSSNISNCLCVVTKP